MFIRFAIFLCVLCLSPCPQSYAVKPPPSRRVKPKKSPAKPSLLYLSRAFHDLFVLGILTSRDLLLCEAQRGAKTIGERLRVRTNASMSIQVTRAYRYFLSLVRKHFPENKDLWNALSIQNKHLEEAAEQLAESIVRGKVEPETLKMLRQVKEVAWMAKPLSKSTQAKVQALIDAIEGAGTGNEMLVYYRLHQWNPLLVRPSMAKGMTTWKAFLAGVKRQQTVFQRLAPVMAKSARKVFASFATHASMFAAVAKLMRSSSKSTKHQKALQKVHAQWFQSLKKANSKFVHIWHLAKNERFLKGKPQGEKRSKERP